MVLASASGENPFRDHSQLLQCFAAVSLTDRVAIEDEEASLTFAQVAEQALALAAQLVAEGAAGQRVALLAPQDRHWPIGFWAILLAGATVVPLSPLHPESEQRGFLEASGARFLLLATALGSSSLGFGAAQPEEITGSSMSSGSPMEPRRLEYNSPAQPVASPQVPGSWAPFAESPFAPKESSVALILFTSGTTGRPKGVLISHANFFAGVDTLSSAWGFSEADVLLHVLPLHHLHGISVSLMCAFCSGAKSRMLPGYKAERVLTLARECTVLMGVPTQHKKLVEAYDALPPGQQRDAKAALSSLRLVTSGSAKLPEGLADRMEELCGRLPLERYGMTEVGIVLSNPLEGQRKRGSCGKPLPGCEVRIVDEQGIDVGSGASGEIWIKGPSVFLGYDQNPAATEQAFTDGFFRSGDTATWTEDGYVKILGRTSVDIIKSGGYKLSALEIEEQLRAHSVVGEVAVVGIPDETWGERVVAVIVLQQDVDSGPEQLSQQLRGWLKERMAGYKVPKQFLFETELPRNTMGKVQKTVLIRRLSQPSVQQR